MFDSHTRPIFYAITFSIIVEKTYSFFQHCVTLEKLCSRKVPPSLFEKFSAGKEAFSELESFPFGVFGTMRLSERKIFELGRKGFSNLVGIPLGIFGTVNSIKNFTIVSVGIIITLHSV